MATPIHADAFYHDGRGPELRRIHWKYAGRVLLAADYSNHDDCGEAAARHVRFARVQVVQITPEEVIDYSILGPALTSHRPAAMFDLGKSTWLDSFSPRHLDQCVTFSSCSTMSFSTCCVKTSAVTLGHSWTRLANKLLKQTAAPRRDLRPAPSRPW